MSAGRAVRFATMTLLSVAIAGCGRVTAGDADTRSSLNKPVADAGCGPVASLDFPSDTPDDLRFQRGPTWKPPLGGLSNPTEEDLASLGVDRPSIPAPAATYLQLELLSPWADGAPTADTRLVQVFAPDPVANLSVWDVLLAKGWIVSEGPPRGLTADRARALLAAVGNDGKSVFVQIGPHRALLVHEDPIDEAGSRPYGIHWSDGTRDMSVQAIADPAAIVGYARSLYCSTP